MPKWVVIVVEDQQASLQKYKWKYWIICNWPNHQHTIPLMCEIHHRLGKDSIHLGKNLFVEKYGTEQSILHKINRELELMEDAYNLFGDK